MNGAIEPVGRSCESDGAQKLMALEASASRQAGEASAAGRRPGHKDD